jgi:hypothetical protein
LWFFRLFPLAVLAALLNIRVLSNVTIDYHARIFIFQDTPLRKPLRSCYLIGVELKTMVGLHPTVTISALGGDGEEDGRMLGRSRRTAIGQ